jgi:predicted RNase H-like nuclease
MKFIGIDLGWQSGPSGLCVMEWVEGSLVLQALDRKDTLTEVLDWVDAHAPTPQPAILAIDAPTLIPNETGMRLPDRLAHKHFGKYHAGCYPANLGRPFAKRIVRFGQDLEARGFLHAPTIEAMQPGRYQIEVFPHPATIQLFNLAQILKYKKGRLAERAQALGELRSHILTQLPQQNPPLVIADLPLIPTTGRALKALEDQLDSIICAYVAAHWWYWGTTANPSIRNWVMGDLETGYIVIPCPLGSPVRPPTETVQTADCLVQAIQSSQYSATAAD